MRPIEFLLIAGLVAAPAVPQRVEAQFTKRVAERIKQAAAERKRQTEENTVNRAAEPADSAMARVSAPIESLTARVGGKAGAAVGRIGRGPEAEEQGRLRQELAMGRAELPGIKFVTGGDALDPASEPSLRSLATVLTESPGVFLIQGRADPGAAPADAAQVANARAAAIKAWLVGNGIPAERVFAAGEAAAVPGAPLVTVTRMQ